MGNNKGKSFHFPGRAGLRFARGDWGVLHVLAVDEADLFRGLGYAHGLDRALQLLLMRILGRGQGSQHLAGDAAMLRIDCFFRRMHWYGGSEAELAKLSPQARALCAAYCEGLNARLGESVPWELRVLGYRPDPWTLADCLLLSRMTGYISLSQSQAEIENLLLQMVQQGVSRSRIEALFGPLPELDEELLRAVRHGEFIVPEDIRWSQMLPKMVASNNWVISGRKTASGRAMLANDPHLEGNRLPNVWYEAVLQTPERYAVAATMPGLPGVLLGRGEHLAWGATYTFMDAVDSWVEQVEDGKYRRQVDGEDQWLPLRERVETIERKGAEPVTVRFYETDHGVLGASPDSDGYYLATRWASAESGGESLNRMLAMWRADSVREGMALLGGVETSWNWVLADSEGHIGYQMSGRMPKRREGLSGLVPVPGWLAENDWQGFVPADELPRAYDPAEGFFVTANHDLNPHGKVRAINMPMGAYRAERIAATLRAKERISVADCQALQLDDYSLQAEALMALLRPLLPDTTNGRILADWDLRYSPDSQGAWLFERVYRALIEALLGSACGEAVCRRLLDETGIVADFYASFDRILLTDDPAWFETLPREQLCRQALSIALAEQAMAWGERNRFVLRHLLFGGKLPLVAGFDLGPIPVAGGRATPRQGQIYRSGERETSFVPSFRLVTDFAAAGAHTCLLGGPSDRRFSPWYGSEIALWQQGGYKYLSPSRDKRSRPDSIPSPCS